MIVLEEIKDCILTFDRAKLKTKIEEAIEAKIDPQVILNEGLIAAMEQVGRQFEAGEFFIPEMLLAGRTMQDGLTALKPHLVGKDMQSKGKIIMGTVKGDLHDIGKNLVGMMLEGAGFEVIDLGVDIPAEKFVETLQKNKDAKILALSALLTTTMSNMEPTITALSKAGIRKDVKVMVGGAPLSESYAKQIGADGYAPDASRAVNVAKTMLSK